MCVHVWVCMCAHVKAIVHLVATAYEAMETYFAENDDEVTMKAGERVEVIGKSMDGWWKIR